MFNIENSRTALLLGNINGLYVDATYVGNVYPHKSTKENIYTVSGPEFDEWEFQVLIFVRSIYGLNTSMSRRHEEISDNINLVGFLHYKEDPDLWIQDVGYHYKYSTFYSVELLVFIKYPSDKLREFNILSPLKIV